MNTMVVTGCHSRVAQQAEGKEIVPSGGCWFALSLNNRYLIDFALTLNN